MSSQPPNARYQALGDGDLTPEQLDGMDLWDRDVMLDERHRAIGAHLVRRAVTEIRRRRAEEQAFNALAATGAGSAVPADPALAWISEHALALEAHTGKYIAFTTAQGIVAVAASLGELYTALEGCEHAVHIHYVALNELASGVPPVTGPADLTTEELRGYSEDKHWPLREMARELLWRRRNSDSSPENPQPGERRDMIALRNTLASARAAKVERFTIGIEVAETASRLAWLTLERATGATAAPGATVPRPDQSLPCKHARTERGKNAQRSWGTWRTQVCLDCGSFRTHAHDDAPDTSPGWTKSRWRPAAEYEEAVMGELESALTAAVDSALTAQPTKRLGRGQIGEWIKQLPRGDASLTTEITMSIGPQPKIKSGAELDYDMARKAAERIAALCKEAFFTPPENAPAHLNNIEEVCTCIQAIADGLRLIKNH